MITGTRKGIGRHLAEHFLAQGHTVLGLSRQESDLQHPAYEHHCLDITDEPAVLKLFGHIRTKHKKLNALVNNAGIASMNHALLTTLETGRKILETNVLGTFLFCREAAKLMQPEGGRIINFTTVAVPLKLEGEALYAASKAAVEALTQVLAKEFAPLNITVNAVGPTPVKTDLIRGVPQEKLERLIARQALPRLGTVGDVTQVIDYYLAENSDYVTGQILYLGGV